MTGQEVAGKLNQMHESALQEICNILTAVTARKPTAFSRVEERVSFS
jgi:chemotaxis protein CheY-P-specific phosphatase CheC